MTFPPSYIIEDSDPQVILQIDTTIHRIPLSVFSTTRAIFHGMDEIVREMRVNGGDGPIPHIGYILRADDVAIDVYTDEERGDYFTCSIAESVLRGTWELFAEYGFSNVYMEIFLGSQAEENQVGEIYVQGTLSNGSAAAAVPAATDT